MQGAYLRPLQFFNGQGELMGHIWSGTASEATPAYTAITLLHDHRQTVRMQNGADLRIDALGANSVDLNGQVQFSLWNKNAKCQVDNKYAFSSRLFFKKSHIILFNYSAGYAIEGTLIINARFISLKSQFTITQEPKLKLVSDSEFSSEVMLCIQLSQPDTILR